MSIGMTTRPEVEEPRHLIGLHPHVRQGTAEVAARVCATLPIAAVLTAVTGLATGAILVLRRLRAR